MSTVVRRGWMLTLVCVIALPAVAAFQASDLIYVPVVAHNTGTASSVWRSDLFITNVDETDVDVIMVYLPSGIRDNSGLFNSRDEWLGGREDEGFGHILESLADIPPRATVVIEDVVGAYWEDMLGLEGKGGLVIFAHEAGTLDTERVYRNVVAMSRTYNTTTVWQPDSENPDEFVEVEVSYGQEIPGVPWYNLADPAAIGDFGDFTYQVLLGGGQTDDFRYNVGILNASDPQTTISVLIKPYQADGEPFTNTSGTELGTVISMPPLSHYQYNSLLATLFGLEDVEVARIQVSFVGWSTSSVDPNPAMTCYGSMVDNSSNDPTTILPSFAGPYDVDCMWPSPTGKSLRRRALAPPPRGTRN